MKHLIQNCYLKGGIYQALQIFLFKRLHNIVLEALRNSSATLYEIVIGPVPLPFNGYQFDFRLLIESSGVKLRVGSTARHGLLSMGDHIVGCRLSYL
jgi:hypothetical protein